MKFIIDILRKKDANPKEAFTKGTRGRCGPGNFTFIALEDSIPYVDRVPPGEYISMRVLVEQTGEILSFAGYPTCYLERLE